MEAVVTRSIAGGALALAVIVGGWTGWRLSLDIQSETETLLSERVTANQAQSKALEREAGYRKSEAFFNTRVEAATETHGVARPSLERLREPNTFHHPITRGEAKIVTTDAPLRKAGLELRVKVEEREVRRRGLTIKNQHTLARVRNVGESPVAYFLKIGSSTSDCQVHALSRHNAMALMPGEEVEIAICAGAHALEVFDLRVMEITELGALWVSKIPPQAVGHDQASARAHHPGRGVEMCAEIPAVEFGERVHRGNAAWEDIVDFYSRHDCEHYSWPPDYERIVEPLAALPATSG